jgi:hypothetical protein
VGGIQRHSAEAVVGIAVHWLARASGPDCLRKGSMLTFRGEVLRFRGSIPQRLVQFQTTEDGAAMKNDVKCLYLTCSFFRVIQSIWAIILRMIEHPVYCLAVLEFFLFGVNCGYRFAGDYSHSYGGI